MQEIWKPIEGYEWLYQVSSLGRVKSLHFWIGKILKYSTNNLWYSFCVLYKESNRKTFILHRLVAQAFIENKSNLPVVMHIDNNPSNNSLSNLKWWTQKNNMKQMYSDWRAKNHFQVNHPRINLWKFWSSHPRSIKVNQFDVSWNFIKMFLSIVDAEIELWVRRSSITQCCKWNRKKAGWFVWKYSSKYE
jgi:hypothetical protein